MANTYEDIRLKEIETDKQAALAETEAAYDSVIGSADQLFKDQVDASKEWAEKQTQLQKANTDFTIEQIEQQKVEAQKNYIKEQSAAYVDYQKEANKYGATAEEMATGGFTGSGYSESSQVALYNQYQNRVATGRETYESAVTNYNNAMTEARLQNDSLLAEIAYTALEEQLSAALEGTLYNNQLILEKANKKTELEESYYNRYLNMLDQINAENELAEAQRQYDLGLAEDQRQYDLGLAEDQRQYDLGLAEDQRQYDLNYELSLKELAENMRQFDSSQNFNAAQAELDRRHDIALTQLEISYKQAEATLERQHELTLAQISNEQERSMLEAEYKQKLALIERQFEQEKESLALEYENELALMKEAAKIDAATTESEDIPMISQNTTSSKSDSADALKYGTLSNGQPAGVGIHGKVSVSGLTISVETEGNNGKTTVVEQDVYRAADGTLWYWSATENKYVEIKDQTAWLSRTESSSAKSLGLLNKLK